MDKDAVLRAFNVGELTYEAAYHALIALGVVDPNAPLDVIQEQIDARCDKHPDTPWTPEDGYGYDD